VLLPGLGSFHRPHRLKRSVAGGLTPNA
jgi:hypothetical protein